MNSHKELIMCPNCNKQQMAKVEHTVPHWTYTHECKNCGYIITESEWEHPESDTKEEQQKLTY